MLINHVNNHHTEPRAMRQAPKIVLKSSFLRCDMARYYGGICINHTVLKRISSKKIFRTVVPLCGGGDSNGKHALKPHTVAVSVV